MKIDLYGWMPQENRQVLKKLIKQNDIKTVIEIGCFLGKSTHFFAKRGCHVLSIDTFEGAKDLNRCKEVIPRLPNLFEQFKFNMQALGLTDRVSWFKGTSADAHKIFKHSADLVYIDGSHEYEDVINDINLWMPRATKIICGDDYSGNHPGVTQAVDELIPNANTKNRVWFKKI